MLYSNDDDDDDVFYPVPCIFLRGKHSCSKAFSKFALISCSKFPLVMHQFAFTLLNTNEGKDSLFGCYVMVCINRTSQRSISRLAHARTKKIGRKFEIIPKLPGNLPCTSKLQNCS